MKRFLPYLLSIVCVCACEFKQTNNSRNFKDTETSISEELKKIGLPDRLDFLIDNLILSDNMILSLSTDTSIFSSALLNSNELAKLYTTTHAKAVNMGIYGADLNYLIHFGQSQNSIKYLIVSKQLADQIGVAMAFDQAAIEEYQSNLENKDALINIIFVSYDNIKKMLKNEDQFLLSTLVIVGSWIENMHITTELLPLVKSTELTNTLLEKISLQKDYLTKTIALLNDLNEGNIVFINELLLDLKKTEQFFITLGDKLIDEDDVASLHLEIKTMRSKIINVN